MSLPAYEFPHARRDPAARQACLAPPGTPAPPPGRAATCPALKLHRAVREHVCRLIFAFQDRHTDIVVDISLSDEPVSVVQEGVDIALRLGPLVTTMHAACCADIYGTGVDIVADLQARTLTIRLHAACQSILGCGASIALCRDQRHRGAFSRHRSSPTNRSQRKLLEIPRDQEVRRGVRLRKGAGVLTACGQLKTRRRSRAGGR